MRSSSQAPPFFSKNTAFPCGSLHMCLALLAPCSADSRSTHQHFGSVPQTMFSFLGIRRAVERGAADALRGCGRREAVDVTSPSGRLAAAAGAEAAPASAGATCCRNRPQRRSRSGSGSALPGVRTLVCSALPPPPRCCRRRRRRRRRRAGEHRGGVLRRNTPHYRSTTAKGGERQRKSSERQCRNALRCTHYCPSILVIFPSRPPLLPLMYRGAPPVPHKKRAGTFSLSSRRVWKGRSVFSRATENGPAFCEYFVCTNKYTAALTHHTIRSGMPDLSASGRCTAAERSVFDWGVRGLGRWSRSSRSPPPRRPLRMPPS